MGHGCVKVASREDVLWAWGIVTPSNVTQVTVYILTENSGAIAQRSDSNGGILDTAAG